MRLQANRWINRLNTVLLTCCCLCSFVVICILRRGYPECGFSVLFPRLQGKCQGKTSQDGAQSALFQNCCVVLCIVCFLLFYVLFVCKCVLPQGDNPIAVNKYIKFKISWGHHIGLDETEPLTIQTRRIETAFWYVLYPALTWKGICVSRVALNPLPHSLLAVMLRISPTYNGSSVFSRSFGWLSKPDRHSDTKSKSPVQLIMSWHTRCLVLNG